MRIKISRMKLWILLALCALAAAAPNLEEVNIVETNALDYGQIDSVGRNIVINTLIRQMFAYIRHVINNGSNLLGLPALDPLELDEFHLVIPAGLINLDLQLKNILMTGMGGFVVHRSNLLLSDLTFDLDISVPRFLIRAEEYDLYGNLFGPIPLYGKGRAEFIIENFRFRALLFLMQSEDGESVIIERIEKASFEIPSFKSNLDGVIGGGNIDAIVNAVIEEVIIDYVNRFQGAISKVGAGIAIRHGNPLLDLLDTWKYIRPFVRNNKV